MSIGQNEGEEKSTSEILNIRERNEFERVERALKEERKRCVEIIKSATSGRGGGSSESFDTGYEQAKRDIASRLEADSK